MKLTNKDKIESVITAKNILLATGGRPFIPNTPGAAEFAITSDDLFWKKTASGKTLIIGGGGYIATECAGLLQGLGYQTDLFYRGAILT